MESPIIAHNKGDVLVFESVELAEQYLEPIDVVNGEYAIYDSRGRRINGVIVTHRGVEHVRLEPASDSGGAADELRRVLVAFLTHALNVPDGGLHESSLEDLVKAAQQFKTK